MKETNRIPYNSPEYWEAKKRIFERDRGRCQSPHCKDMPEWYLKDKIWNLDHKIPVSKQGTNDDSNLRVLCEFCHACRDDSWLGGQNSHRKLALSYILSDRIDPGIIEKYSWGG